MNITIRLLTSCNFSIKPVNALKFHELPYTSIFFWKISLKQKFRIFPKFLPAPPQKFRIFPKFLLALQKFRTFSEFLLKQRIFKILLREIYLQ